MQLILIYNFSFNMLFIDEYYDLNINNVQYSNFWFYFKNQISICQSCKPKIARSYCTNSRNDFLWGQVCGIEFNKFNEKFCYIATPVFETEYSSKGYYRSLIVKNKGNLKCVIFNNKFSYSGCTTLKRFLKLNKININRNIYSGSHINTIKLLVSGKNQIASIDEIIWHHIKKYKLANVNDLEIIHITNPKPLPPWVTSIDNKSYKDLFLKALNNTFQMKKKNKNMDFIDLVDYKKFEEVEYHMDFKDFVL